MAKKQFGGFPSFFHCISILFLSCSHDISWHFHHIWQSSATWSSVRWFFQSPTSPFLMNFPPLFPSCTFTIHIIFVLVVVIIDILLIDIVIIFVLIVVIFDIVIIDNVIIVRVIIDIVIIDIVIIVRVIIVDVVMIDIIIIMMTAMLTLTPMSPCIFLVASTTSCGKGYN